MVVKPAQDLWCDYLFLTREMAKFLLRGDMELFGALMQQRGQLQKLIDEQADRAFIASGEGRKVLGLIREIDVNLKLGLNSRYNRVKQQDTLEKTYAGGLAVSTAGGFMNQKG